MNILHMVTLFFFMKEFVDCKSFFFPKFRYLHKFLYGSFLDILDGLKALS